MSAPNTAGSNRPAADGLESRLAAADRLLESTAAKIRRGSLLTAVVGALLLLLLGGYFAYGYSQFSALMQPDTLVSFAESYVEEQVPEARKKAEEQIIQAAPGWAASLSQQGQEAIPELREKLETFVLENIDRLIDDTVRVSTEEFRSFLRDNRDRLEQGFKDLSTSPKLADESLLSLETALQNRLQTDMQQGAQDLFGTLAQLNQTIGRLQAGRELTPEEVLERRILMTARRLQLQQADPTLQSTKAN
ncbi:MAG: hypothetical protein ACT4QC_14500 [Planctomycetaceae bacterium]